MAERASVAVIGQSHIYALQRGMQPDERFSFTNVTQVSPDWLNEDGMPTPDFLANYDANAHCVAMLAGNFHIAIGLIEHDVRWDFFCDKSTIETADLSRRIIPFGLLYKFFQVSLNVRVLTAATNLRQSFKGRTVFVATPPIIATPEHVRKFPNMFKDKLENGIAPASIRKKLFDLHSRIISEHCEKNDIIYLPPPPESVDGSGCLLKKYWANDPSHANAAYGALLQAQIAKALSL